MQGEVKDSLLLQRTLLKLTSESAGSCAFQTHGAVHALDLVCPQHTPMTHNTPHLCVTCMYVT